MFRPPAAGRDSDKWLDRAKDDRRARLIPQARLTVDLGAPLLRPYNIIGVVGIALIALSPAKQPQASSRAKAIDLASA
jgi:hypothetical protein